jgi:hypothetical protein
VGPFENVGNVEPELPLVAHLSGISSGQMVLHVEIRAPAEVVLRPFCLRVLPVGIAPTGDDQVEAIIYPVAFHNQFLRLPFQIDAGEAIILRTKDDQFFVDDLLGNVIFEADEVGS